MKIEKILLKKVGKFKVFQVSGDAVRKKSLSAEEFGESGFHQQFSFIPEGELWIENNVSKSEIPILIDMMIYQIYKIRSGKSLKEAYDLALNYEKKLREQYFKTKKSPKNKKDWKTELTLYSDKIYKKLWKNWSSPASIAVWKVDGKEVRNHFKTDYMEGGNHFVYPWIPKGEIWIEDGMTVEESLYVLIHEMYESMRMESAKISYNKAHEQASQAEFTIRDAMRGVSKRKRIKGCLDVVDWLVLGKLFAKSF